MGLGYGLISCQRTPGDPRSWEDLYAEALQLAERAEQLGFSVVWTTEHHFVDDGYMPSLLPVAAAMAARTERILLGTGVLLAPLHDPLRIAEDAATVQVLSRGRLLLGLGLGWSDIEFEALRGVGMARRGRAMTEILQILRLAGGGEPFRHAGEVYDLPNVGVRPTPTHQVPLLIGGGADAALRRAGRLADGFFSNAPPHRLPQQVATIVAALEEAGRDPAHFRWHYYAYVLPGDDPDVAWRELEPHLWASRWKYSDMGASASRRGPIAAPPPVDAAAMGRLRAMALVGPEEHIAEQVTALRREAGVDFEFTARAYYPAMPLSRQLEIIDRLGEGLLPLL